MREGFSGVVVTAQALRQTYPGWNAVDDWSDDVAPFHAFASVSGFGPVVAVNVVETSQELEVQEGVGEAVQLIGQPKIGEADVEERGTQHAALKLDLNFKYPIIKLIGQRL